ncbi:MAG: ATP-binding protein [Bacteroidales bacterium]|nr:ATP-binding protein [Bacteroidales bacterium]
MTERIFRRKIYSKMLEWKRENDGKSALLIEGARRVGKSTIVEAFAKNEYDSYLVIDFNKASQAIKSLFDDLMDLEYLFLYLQTTYRVTLKQRKSVIIFDEVQKCPMARQAIKYLVEDGRYDYIETGSLISIKKNTESITIPSEEDRIQMYPMDYEEFRWALGDELTVPLLRQFWEQRHPLGPAHRDAARNLRLYMLVGGMPQAVDAYLETNNFSKVDMVKRRILKLYDDDFLKIDPSGRVSRMFRSIPGQLSKNAIRYIPYSSAGRMDEEKQAELLMDLTDSKTVNIVYHADDPQVGMGLTKNQDRFKLFVGDTGLFVTLAFWDKDFTENIIYEKLLSDKLPANLGYIYENLVAQMLVAGGNELYYHAWPRDEKHYYEIDFLVSRGAKICPIEVKSSGYNTHASLDAFCKKYSSRVQWRYLIYTKDLSKDENTILLPAYMTMFI